MLRTAPSVASSAWLYRGSLHTFRPLEPWVERSSSDTGWLLSQFFLVFLVFPHMFPSFSQFFIVFPNIFPSFSQLFPSCCFVCSQCFLIFFVCFPSFSQYVCFLVFPSLFLSFSQCFLIFSQLFLICFLVVLSFSQHFPSFS